MKAPLQVGDWVDYRAARRMVQAAADWMPSDDDAGRWLVDHAAHGKIRTDLAADLAEELFGLHLGGEPGLEQQFNISRARWSTADIRMALATKPATTRKPGRRGPKPKWRWPDAEAELVAKFPNFCTMQREQLARLLQEIATNYGPGTPELSHCRKKIRVLRKE